MAQSTLPVVAHPDFPQIYVSAIDSMVARIARALVHLNFDEPKQAQNVLLDALTDFNFTRKERV